MSFLRNSILLAALWSSACAKRPAQLRIAAAADLRFALDDVIRNYSREHSRVTITPSYGSSGLFYAQLSNHAPFDLFLSADVQYPHKLAEQGSVLAGSEFDYAVGRLVLWTSNTSGIDLEHLGMQALRLPTVKHIAIANPEHAPYGRAAAAALHSLGLYDAVKARLVMGENISQAFQLAQSGAAEVGIVALSLAMVPGAGGHYWEVPATAYPRLEQGGAILKWTANPEAAQQFRAFLLAPEGRAILKRYGFSGE